MSEPPNAQSDAPLSPRVATPAPDEGGSGGVSLRVDRPHLARENAPTPAETAHARAFPARSVPLDPSAGVDVRLLSVPGPPPGEDDHDLNGMALETSQIAAQLRRQYADVDRREKRLHSQLAQFDQERRELRMWSGELQSGLEERESAIARQEAALAERADACLKLEAELKELHESLLRERHSLNLERDQLVEYREQQDQLL
jgi:hypothetical protein